MIAFDSLFEPIAWIADAGGPMKAMLFCSNWVTKLAFSERKPYPGWIA